MKKIVALLAALLMGVSLVACGTPEPTGPTDTTDGEGSLQAQAAYALWETASKAQQDAESMSFEIDYQMAMQSTASAEDAIAIKMQGPVKTITKSPTDMQLAFDFQMEMLGQSLSMQAWYLDGYYYYDMMGMKFKQAMSTEEALQQNNAKLLTFAEAAIKEQSLTEASNGGKQLSFLLDGKAMTDLVSGALSAAGTQDADASAMDIEMSDVTVTAAIDKDGNLTECAYKFTFTMDYGDSQMTAESDVSLSGIQYGNVTIDFPTDLDSYTESSF
jgi:hypothetical protein